MTRAEKAAWKAYPGKITVINEDGTESIWEDSVLDGERRRLFVKGYEQAEKDNLHKVEKWLAEMHRVCDITDENGYRIELRDLTASLEKAMEEE